MYFTYLKVLKRQIKELRKELRDVQKLHDKKENEISKGILQIDISRIIRRINTYEEVTGKLIV